MDFWTLCRFKVPEPIDLKFDRDDCVAAISSCQKSLRAIRLPKLHPHPPTLNMCTFCAILSFMHHGCGLQQTSQNVVRGDWLLG